MVGYHMLGGPVLLVRDLVRCTRGSNFICLIRLCHDNICSCMLMSKTSGSLKTGPYIFIISLQEIAKRVLVKDFDYFVDRRKFFHVDPDDRSDSPNKYFSNTLMMLEGDQWRQVRSMVSPIFTSGRLRGMNPTINKIADEFLAFLMQFAESGKELDAKEAMVRLTLDVICECGFGVKGNGIAEENGIFRKMVGV